MCVKLFLDLTCWVSIGSINTQVFYFINSIIKKKKKASSLSVDLGENMSSFWTLESEY